MPFKGGPDATLALAQNEIQMFAASLSLALQFMQKNLIRPLAMMVDQRSPLLPGVPTLKEEGIDLPALSFWGGLAAPAGTPQPVIAALQRLVAAGVADSGLIGKYAAAGMKAVSSPPQEFSRLIEADLAWMRTAVRDANLQLD